MEHQKISNLLNEANDCKFATKTWNMVIDQSNANYDVGNEIFHNTEVSKSIFCDYNDAYILVRGGITTQLLQHKYHLKILHNLLNVSHKLMEQRKMMLKI